MAKLDEPDLLELFDCWKAFAYELANKEAAACCCCLLEPVPVEAAAAASDKLLSRLEAFKLGKLVEDEELEDRLSLVLVRIEPPVLDDIDT